MIVVIGHHPDYLVVAAALDAAAFDIPESEWAALDDQAKWERNRTFLDSMVAENADIVLATDPGLIKRPSFLAMEIDYLVELGYRIDVSQPYWRMKRDVGET